MKLHQPSAEIFIPDGQSEKEALSRVTHLGIGAHQDDLEFMAFHGIVACHSQSDQWFGGVTCTDGGGSARKGRYAELTDAQMIKIRLREQRDAAEIGRYAAMIQLSHPSRTIKSPAGRDLQNDLLEILKATRPEIVYTHNLADKHDTHVAVTLAALQAMRRLPPSQRPQRVIGCEVWRDLDWLPDKDKVVMDVTGHDQLATLLNQVFDSQISGGKRYDLAILGRRAANATFFDSHTTDTATQVIFGMDLTPLVKDASLDIADYTCDLIQKFQNSVRDAIDSRTQKPPSNSYILSGLKLPGIPAEDFSSQ